MLYLSSFDFPGEKAEYNFRAFSNRGRMTCYQSLYPFGILPERDLESIIFRPVTILYGGNGSGKSTVLNIIAQCLGLQRDSAYNRSDFYDDFLCMCHWRTENPIPEGSRIITSDDVFDFMLDIRAMNDGVEQNRRRLADDYWNLQHSDFRLRSMDDYDQLKKMNDARRQTPSRFISSRSQDSLREQSNGESALQFFRQRIESDTLCLLDEPENSLSAENQVILADFLAESARYCGCQLVISTHSPFLLALPGAKIIDLDHGSRVVDSWAELKNMQVWYHFFASHSKEFESD